MKQYLVVDKDGNQQGPIDEQTLLEQYKAGVYHADTLVWIMGSSEQWMNLGAVLNLGPDKGEEFFPTSHPIWTCFLLLALPTLCVWGCTLCEDRELLLCMNNLWGRLAEMVVFYLTCWRLAGADKTAIRGLATHALLLHAAGFVALAPFAAICAAQGTAPGEAFSVNEFIVCCIFAAATYFIPRKLYGFSVGKSWTVIGIQMLVTGTLLYLFELIFPAAAF